MQRLMVAAALALASAAFAAPARAQVQAPPPPPASPSTQPSAGPTALPPPDELPPLSGAGGEAEDPRMPPPEPEPTRWRPAMSVAIGMGATLDRTGFEPGRTEPIPAFLAIGRIGDQEAAAFELSVFASQASGRFRLPDAPVDRLGIAAGVALRPFRTGENAGDARYGIRVLRSVGVEVGLGLERAGRGPQSGSRFGANTGLHVELPLAREGARHELRIRLGARRFFGLYTPNLGGTSVGNTVDLYGALAVAF